MSKAAEQSDEKFLLSPEEAESLLHKGKYVHNYIGGGGIMVGCDYDRADAIAAFKTAQSIEIGGGGCKAMKHPIAVFDKDGRLSFFAADMDKVEALEASRLAEQVS